MLAAAVAEESKCRPLGHPGMAITSWVRLFMGNAPKKSVLNAFQIRLSDVKNLFVKMHHRPGASFVSSGLPNPTLTMIGRSRSAGAKSR